MSATPSFAQGAPKCGGWKRRANREMQRRTQPVPVNSVEISNGRQPWSSRPPTVDEALQYSPFSSIVPFGPGAEGYNAEAVAVPVTANLNLPPLFSNFNERNASRQTLEVLNREAQAYNNRPSLLSHTVQNVRILLEPNELTRYSFKSLASFGHQKLHGTPQNAENELHKHPSVLSPFAKVVLDSTNVGVGSAKPRTAKTALANGHSPRRTRLPSPVGTSKVGGNSSNVEAYLSQVQIRAEPAYNHPKLAVIVPQLSPSQHEEYEVFSTTSSVNEQGAKAGSLIKRKDQRKRHGHGPLVRGPDYGKKSEASLRSLQHLISRIFEAEDQLQPDTSGIVASFAADFFISSISAEGPRQVLASSIQSELDVAIQAVVSHGRLEEISLDSILRIQKLCEESLKSAEATVSELVAVLSRVQVNQVVQDVDIVDAGLRSAKILLRIVTGRLGEKQIYSEEMLQSTLNLLKSMLEAVILPIFGLKSSGPSAELFEAMMSQKQTIITLFNHVLKILRLLDNLLARKVLTESAVTAIEFLATSLIFVENAHSEKASILGVRKCESLRVIAMDILIQTFSRYSDHRTFIFDEILTSLEKLPVSRQKARQYRLADGKSIQLVSALIMRLVQTNLAKTETGSGVQEDKDKVFGDEPSTPPDTNDNYVLSTTGEHHAGLGGSTHTVQQPGLKSQKLFEKIQSLISAAQKNAQYVVQFLVLRALKSTKTGEDPYRVLLDIFTEDLISVVDSPNWPASELLLRSLLTSMIGLAEGEKTVAPARNLALDLMGTMGATLSNLVAYLRQTCKSLETSKFDLDGQLMHLINSSLNRNIDDDDPPDWTTSYRVILRYLDETESLGPSQTATDFHLIQWAYKAYGSSELAKVEDDRKAEVACTSLIDFLHHLLAEKYASSIVISDTITSAQARIAYTLVISKLPFGAAYERILAILLNSLNSDQATVRSKGLKSVIQLIENDPTILDRGTHVMRYILNRASDPSPLVRDSALGLVGKLLTLRPALEEQILETAIARTADAQVGVRKRSMKILKDVYLRSFKAHIRAAIAEALLHRISDADEGVSELATRLLEEVWILPFTVPADGDRAVLQQSLAMREHVSLIIKTVQRGGNTPTVLGSFLRTLLSDSSKNATANFRICKELVATMFNDIVDCDDQAERPSRRTVMQALTVFAQANASLFRADQLEHLQIYIEHLSNNDDLHIFRSVVIVFRWVLPHLTNISPKVLTAVQKALLESLAKLGKRELNEVIPCLWTINRVLKTIERLSKVVISCLKGIISSRNADLQLEGQKRLVTSVIRYINIAGLFGRYCDFESDSARFRAEFPWWQEGKVSALLIDVFAPFTSPKKPKAVRGAALDGLGAVCQKWPKLYLREQVLTSFDMVFAEDSHDLKSLVLGGFKEFLGFQDSQSANLATSSGVPDGNAEPGRLAGALTANQNDGVATSIAQRYLPQTSQLATASQDGLALLATEVIAVINRQGLVHPKECVCTLVAITTSQNPAISRIALREYRSLHQKHETIVEKEYMKAVQRAFDYQKDVVLDDRGIIIHPIASKLQQLFDVVKTSKAKVRKKFLGNLCTKIDFDPLTLNMNDSIPLHLRFARFVVENLAFFEYGTVEELLHVVSCLERVVSSTGAAVAHSLETEIFGEFSSASMTNVSPQSEVHQRVAHQIDTPHLRRLTACCVILSIVWDTRTHLRRLYGLNSSGQRRETKSKASAKDINKVPTKISGVTGQNLLDAIEHKLASFSTPDSMIIQCSQFMELMTVDQELKVAAETEVGPGVERLETPSDSEVSVTPGPPNGSGKSRKRKTESGAASKKSRKRQRSSISRATAVREESGGEHWG